MIVSLKLGVDCNPLPPILVKLTGSDEVVLIELQGSIATTGDTAGQLVGTLSIDPANNKPILRIGHHLLEGAIQTLAKPCAVIARSSSRDPGHSTDGENHGKLGTNLGIPNDSSRKPGDLGRDPCSGTHLHSASQLDIGTIDNQGRTGLDEPGGDDTVTAKEKRVEVKALDDMLELEPLEDIEVEQFVQNPHEVSYDIVTIVRKKIVFANRPIPIVPSSLKGLSSITVNTGSSSAGASGAGDGAVGHGADD